MVTPPRLEEQPVFAWTPSEKPVRTIKKQPGNHTGKMYETAQTCKNCKEQKVLEWKRVKPPSAHGALCGWCRQRPSHACGSFFSFDPNFKDEGLFHVAFFFCVWPSDTFQVSCTMAENILDSKGQARRMTLAKPSSKPLRGRARIFVQNGKATTLKPATGLRPPGNGSRRSDRRNFLWPQSRDHLWVSHSRSEMCSWDQIDNGATREKSCMTCPANPVPFCLKDVLVSPMFHLPCSFV